MMKVMYSFQIRFFFTFMRLSKNVHDKSMTVKQPVFGHLHSETPDKALNFLKTIAFTHHNTPVKELHRFFLHEENRKERLAYIKFNCELNEVMYLATCNRIEFIFTTHQSCDEIFLARFFKNFRPDWEEKDIEFAVKHASVYEGEDALRHLYRVASSLESLVVGEREIITQVRKAYDECYSEGLTGDFLRLVIKSTVTAAKQVYTNTKIANNPVSVVSLAERKIRELKPDPNQRILMVGSGETNANLAKYLVKHGFKQFDIFNRTLEHAESLARMISSDSVSANAYSLDSLATYYNGFDILITCTSSAEPVITPAVYTNLLNADTSEKLLVDLAIPSDIHPSVLATNNVAVIDISELKVLAEKNLEERKSEFAAAEEIIDENVRGFRHLHRTRSLELKMKEVPEKIREIKDKAVNDVFAREIEGLDDKSKALLTQVLDYMEKKCISVPMVMAKEIILETSD
ncbi:MAG: glutamyl-tRNA reductase [Bacteroidetes bacterium]|nr:MAG: glutamyl-tRNA reductase [Bacteroidota bacterium]